MPTLQEAVQYAFAACQRGAWGEAEQWCRAILQRQADNFDALFLLGVWACGVTGRNLGVHDHGAMVWDEIVAFLLVAALLPRSLPWQVAGFVVFRGFDIGKPPPIRWIERRWQGGFGVMFDDLVAAGYTLLVLALVQRLFSNG